MQGISPQETVIALMGPTGAGKSTFIQIATGDTGQIVGHQLKSCTSEVRSIRTSHPRDGRPVVFVDTPGFDDTYKSDVEVLAMIAKWLAKVYKGKVVLTGVLYLHRISDDRVSGSVLRNFNVFQMKFDVGARREEELMNEYWKPMLDTGSRAMRFLGTYESAWTIVDSIVELDSADAVEGRDHGAICRERKTNHMRRSVNGPSGIEERPLRIQEEMVDQSLRLNETEAAKTLFEDLQKLLQEQKDATRRLHELARKHDNKLFVEKLNEQKAEIDEKIQKTTIQLNELKINLLQRITGFFRAKK